MKIEKEAYKKKNRKIRHMQFIYGSKFFSLPFTFKCRIKKYEKYFGIKKVRYIGYDVTFYLGHNLNNEIEIGENTVFSNHVTIDYSGGVTIGSDVTVGEGTIIHSHKHPMRIFNRYDHTAVAAPVRIGDGAWIGAKAIIYPGVEIGEGATILAGAVVTNNVNACSVVCGNPAKEVYSPKGIKINERKD